jgi:hypothetical protein
LVVGARLGYSAYRTVPHDIMKKQPNQSPQTTRGKAPRV